MGIDGKMMILRKIFLSLLFCFIPLLCFAENKIENKNLPCPYGPLGYSVPMINMTSFAGGECLTASKNSPGTVVQCDTSVLGSKIFFDGELKTQCNYDATEECYSYVQNIVTAKCAAEAQRLKDLKVQQENNLPATAKFIKKNSTVIFVCVFFVVLLALVVLNIIGYDKAKRGEIKVFYNYADIIGACVFGLFSVMLFGMWLGVTFTAFSLQAFPSWLKSTVIAGSLLALACVYNAGFAYQANKTASRGVKVLVFFVRIAASWLIAICAIGLLDSIFPKRDEHGRYPNIITQIFLLSMLSMALRKLTSVLVNVKRVEVMVR